MEEHVIEKLALIPDHAKLVVSPSEFRGIDKVPETLHLQYPVLKVPGFLPLVYRDAADVSFFTWMIDIFNKRWQTLDLISMMQELQRTAATNSCGYHHISDDLIFMKDSLSTLPIFQKKEEEHSP